MHTNRYECLTTEHTEFHGNAFVFLRAPCVLVVKKWACRRTNHAN
jgi:hypothetical protein